MIEHKCFVFTFADVEVREREFYIVKAREVLPVEPKAFRVLLFLIRNPHRLITKDELLNAVWNDVAVSENSLTRSIALLRRLLGDDTREPRYIATVPTVGYRFLCDVEAREDGFRGVDAPDLRHPDNGDGFESFRKTHGVQGGSQNPQNQTAVADEVEERVERPSDEGRRQSRRLLLPGLIATVLVIFGAAFLVYRAVTNRGRSAHTVHLTNAAAAPSRMRVVQLTNLPGIYSHPTFSPNGEQIAFVWDGENPFRGDLYIQLIGGDRPLRLTHTRSGFVCCADWSPDGREIVFGRCDDNGGGVFIVPALGGTERKVTDVGCPYGLAGTPQWTADGLSLVLADRCVPDGGLGIVVFSLQTGERRCLHMPPSGDAGDIAPTLSPDQQTVAFLSRPTVGLAHLYTISFSGKDLRQLTFDDGDGDVFSPLMWSADGKYIVFNVSNRGLVRVPATGGALERETVYPHSGALSPDRRRLAYIEPGGGWPLWAFVWRMELSSAGGRVASQEKILSSTAENDGIQLSPDEQRVVFQSNRSGLLQIWKSGVDGSAPMQMTFLDEGYPGTPRWSPDGKWIVFDYHTLKHHSQIYMIDSEGRNLHAVTSGEYDNSVPSCSRDGAAIYFASNRTGDWQVWRRELSTGQEMQVTRHGGFAAFESYDGKMLYYSRLEGGGIWSVPRGGGEEQQITAALHRGYWGHFAVTDSGIYFVDSDAEPGPAVMYYNFQTRRLSPVLTLKQNPVPWEAANLAASRDGRLVFYVQAEFRNSTISMAENF